MSLAHHELAVKVADDTALLDIGVPVRVENSSAFSPDSKMPAYGPPNLSHQEIEERSRDAATLRGPEGGSRQPEFRDTIPDPAKPKADQ